MKNKHTFIDLFSGCGGLSLGFEMAGFTGILAIDNWKDALTTYAYNRKNARTLKIYLLISSLIGILRNVVHISILNLLMPLKPVKKR